jgi:glycine/D-amino acid oxidase-like deaminating enzyme
VEPPRSLWWTTLEEPVTPRAPLQRHLDVDVAIVGGGFTGLWTARELLRRDPHLQICLLEKSVCGFGASGRNGGWASALFPLSDDVIVSRYGLDAFTHQHRLLQAAVVDLGASTRADGIDAHFVRGGTLTFARNDIQVRRLKADVASSHDLGLDDGDVTWLDEEQTRERGVVSHSRGAVFTPHCARINPARLVRALSDVDEAMGVTIYENSAVTRIVPGRHGRRAQVVTVGGSVHADYVVRATEGFTPTLPGQRRAVAPLYSLMIATEPLAAAFWEEVGFSHRETFADGRHLIIYAQRTHDDRIAFGGRGAPYHFGSTIEERYDGNDRIFGLLETTLRELFPSLAGEITHRWGGPIAMARDQTPSVWVDSSTGLAGAAGYTGDGVVLSRVAATALADLIATPGVETEFTRLPMVRHRSRRWEFEPLRALGINAALALAARADRTEADKNRESRATKWLERTFGSKS